MNIRNRNTTSHLPSASKLMRNTKIIRNIFTHYFGTTLHKFWVSWYIFKFSMNLFKRAILHDLSKYFPLKYVI